jgi:hypothetical protein
MHKKYVILSVCYTKLRINLTIMHQYYFRVKWSVLLLLVTCVVTAQVKLPSAKVPIIIASSVSRTITDKAQTLNIGVVASSSYTATTTADWLTVTKGTSGVSLAATTNAGSARSASIIFSDGTNSKTLTLTQQANLASFAYTATLKTVTSATATSSYSGKGIENSYDGNTSTFYHSDYPYHDVTVSTPVTLIYNFDACHLDYFTYTPRQDGNNNGNFGQVAIYYKTSGSSDYILYENHNFQMSSYASAVNFGTSGIDNVVSVKFVVSTGSNNNASCAEMQFFSNDTQSSDYAIFADDLYSTLKTGTTQADIDKLTDPFVKPLAQALFNGTYDVKNLVVSEPCILSPSALSEQWCTPGKYYDQNQGVTGIMLTKGQQAVIVSGIPTGKTVNLKVIGWKCPEGSGYYSETFALHNGINSFTRSSEWNGLAYINFYDDTPSNYTTPIKAHFVNGIVNGILSPDKTNAQMDSILAKAPYATIDLFGSKVHSVWECSALMKYAKGRYRQYMNILDTLVMWEQRLLGMEKYNLLPVNKTFAYVNYDFYMYQGGTGVSFKYDTQNRVCNPTNLLYSDDDVIWGLSHEWGHQHQMQPYFCWAGLSESSNNMNSCYNVLHMGYDGSRVSDGWNTARNSIFYDYSNASSGTKNYGISSTKRRLAYQQAATNFAWCDDVKAVALAMQDSVYYPLDDQNTSTLSSKYDASVYTASAATGADRGISTSEVYVESNLAPFFMLHCYFTNKSNHPDGTDYYPDYTMDLYQSLRSTNTDTDKYALLAATQNGKSGKFAAFSAAYPSSVWVTRNYVSASSNTWQNSVPYIFNYCRKASRICGYNLYPFFEKWGFFRIIALVINDYGNKYYVMTKQMRDEFKADMDALVADGTLKQMPEDMIQTISTANIPHYDRPVFPN